MDPAAVILYDSSSENARAELTWLHYRRKAVGL